MLSATCYRSTGIPLWCHLRRPASTFRICSFPAAGMCRWLLFILLILVCGHLWFTTPTFSGFGYFGISTVPIVSTKILSNWGVVLRDKKFPQKFPVRENTLINPDKNCTGSYSRHSQFERKITSYIPFWPPNRRDFDGKITKMAINTCNLANSLLQARI